jgi:phosphatidylglycerol:prolipoprotein diacylglycerol transferase
MIAIAFPAIDPVAIQVGPLSIRWYALAYIAGILLGWWYMRSLTRRPPQALTMRDVDDFVVWATLGVVLGGRLGYVLFYKPGYYLHEPLEALALWQGGMSFHGGLIGVILAIVLFARQRKVSWLKVGDLTVCAVPIGLFFGRIANFVNGELFGRPSDAPWAMVFPHGGPEPRHPSQLYQAALEGLVLFVLLFVLARYTRALERPGFLGGVFLAGYGVARVVGEIFRQPDAHLGFLAFGATMGQLLSVPVLLAGVYLMARAERPK